MSLFSKLFGGGGGDGAASEVQAIEHEGFAIYPEPVKESNGYRIAARIEKEIGGELKSHMLIRADTLDSLDGATEATVNKAKQVINEQGERIFG